MLLQNLHSEEVRGRADRIGSAGLCLNRISAVKRCAFFSPSPDGDAGRVWDGSWSDKNTNAEVLRLRLGIMKT